MPSLFALDPGSLLEATAVHIASTTLGIGTFDLEDAERIDIGQYEHVVLACINGGGTGTIVITPLESDSPTGAQTRLDSLAVSFASSEFEAKHRVIRCAGRKRYLNVEVVVGAAAVRPNIILYGIRGLSGVGPAATANSTGGTLEAEIAPLQVA